MNKWKGTVMPAAGKLDSRKVGVLIYTYNRTDDARVNMEIIRNVWSRNRLLEGVVIIHAFNGIDEWWPQEYLENDLLRLANPGHYDGAAALLDAGLLAFAERYPDIDYVVTLAADTWCLEPDYIGEIINSMNKSNKYLATCAWGSNRQPKIFKSGAAIDFFIADIRWAVTNRLIPLRYAEFKEKFGELFLYSDETLRLERVFVLRFKEAICRSESIPSDNLISDITDKYIHHIKEREPIHVIENGRWRRIMFHPQIGLLGHHDPEEKRLACRHWSLHLGIHGTKFLTSENLSYFNRGIKKNRYKKNGDDMCSCVD
jgi:hypothetical protein